MKKILTTLSLVASTATAADLCTMQERTVTQRRVTISERSQIVKSVVPMPSGERRCTVEFKVRIGNEWHPAHGEYAWDGVRPANEACAAAVQQAERDVEARVNRGAVLSESILICKDNPDAKTVRQADRGTVASNDRFRPHPDYPKYFYHNGTRCRWFLETGWDKNDVRSYSGVICELEDRNWIVVDRF